MGPLDPVLTYLGSAPNIMREISALGAERAKLVGEENVLDLSLGSPSIAPPDAVYASIARHAHGPMRYTNTMGDPECREMLAQKLSERFGGRLAGEDVCFTLGASGALCLCFRALSRPGAEFILQAPFFSEYTVFIEGNGGKPVVVPPNYDTFGLNLPGIEAAIGPNTAGVVINLPNNPAGTLCTPREAADLAELLRRKAREYGHPIYLISDEPYRELVYDGAKAPWFPDVYDDTLVCYSYSKALSLAGARIGYLLVNPAAADRQALWAAIRGAGRQLAYISAPSLFQWVAAECEGLTADIGVYEANRNLLCSGLSALGYEGPKPMGTFYLLLKAPEGDGMAFCRRAMEHNLMVTPTEVFSCPGYVRLAYCCEEAVVRRALEALRAMR